MFTIMGKKQSDHTAKLHVQIFKKEKKKYPVRKVASYGKDGGDDFSQQLRILVGPGFLIVCTFHH